MAVALGSFRPQISACIRPAGPKGTPVSCVLRGEGQGAPLQWGAVMGLVTISLSPRSIVASPSSFECLSGCAEEVCPWNRRPRAGVTKGVGREGLEPGGEVIIKLPLEMQLHKWEELLLPLASQK